jgi:hypothetical protein
MSSHVALRREVGVLEVAALAAAVVGAEPRGHGEVGRPRREGNDGADALGRRALVEGAAADELHHVHERARGGHLDLVVEHGLVGGHGVALLVEGDQRGDDHCQEGEEGLGHGLFR